MEAGNSVKQGANPSPKQPERRNLLRWALLALVLLAALVVWLATRDSGGDSSKPPPAAATAPRIVTAAQLREAAASFGNPVCWAGAIPGKELELTELPEGGARVRYLPAGTKAGGGSVAVLTVSSYPLADPAKSLEGFAKRPGAIVRHAGDGRQVVSSAEKPSSVYLASPDNEVQVEVYDPSPQRAMSLALSGRVRPAG